MQEGARVLGAPVSRNALASSILCMETCASKISAVCDVVTLRCAGCGVKKVALNPETLRALVAEMRPATRVTVRAIVIKALGS